MNKGSKALYQERVGSVIDNLHKIVLTFIQTFAFLLKLLNSPQVVKVCFAELAAYVTTTDPAAQLAIQDLQTRLTDSPFGGTSSLAGMGTYRSFEGSLAIEGVVIVQAFGSLKDIFFIWDDFYSEVIEIGKALQQETMLLKMTWLFFSFHLLIKVP